jgi:sigma-E factor negative regulatory protein RseA
MRNAPDDGTGALQRLSALVDGELDPAATQHVCAQWHGDPAARASWHAYHLIGDVMRSDDLASDTAHDASFLNGLRARLAAEPVVLAPQRREASLETDSERRPARSRRWSLLGPAAVAAGLMAVASALVVTRGSAPLPGATDSLVESAARGNAVLIAEVPKPGAVSTSMPNAVGEAPAIVVDGELLRDARLERYFAAHAQFEGSSALGVPSGFLRAATVQTPER